MRVKDKRKYAARKVVAERFRLYIAELMKQFSTGTDEVWKRVEAKIQKPDERP